MGELNKIVGGVCGALLAFLALNFFAEQVFHPHHEDELAFALDIEDAGEVEEEAEEEIDFAALFAATDVAAGEKVFRKCSACHKLEDGANGVGPHLWGVVERQIGSVDGFNYSGALPADQAWTAENLYAFLAAPREWAPGTSMSFKGLNKPEDKANLIAYLNEADGTPVEFEFAALETETDAAEAPAEEATTETAAAPAAEEAPAEEAAPSEDVAGEEEATEEDAAEAAPAEAAPAEEETALAAEAEAGTETAAAGGSSTSPELLALLQAADAADGEKVFRKCKACHKIEDGANGVGPHLWSVLNRPIAGVDGFKYSDALPADQAWTADNLNAFLEKPRDWAPGTKMSFAGLRKPEDRAAVIVYLNEADGSPEDF